MADAPASLSARAASLVRLVEGLTGVAWKAGGDAIVRRLTPPQLRAVAKYTFSPGSFNYHLRQGEAMANDDWDLVEGLASLPEHHDVTWRGERWDLTAEVIGRFKQGEVIADLGFWSSSISRRVARKVTGHAGVLFEVRAPTGRFIGPASGYLCEREVLFAPGSGFRIRSVKQRGRVLHVVIEEIEWED